MRIALIVLSLALVASVAAGLAGLWPNLRDRSTVSDRRERVQIAEAFDKDILKSGFHVSRVKLDYTPGEALIEVTQDGHTNNVGECAVVTENFGPPHRKKRLQTRGLRLLTAMATRQHGARSSGPACMVTRS